MSRKFFPPVHTPSWCAGCSRRPAVLQPQLARQQLWCGHRRPGDQRLIMRQGVLSPVEHKIRAHLQQRAPGLSERRCEGARRFSIHPMGQLRLRFRAVHRGVSPGTNHPVGPMGGDGSRQAAESARSSCSRAEPAVPPKPGTDAAALTQLTGRTGDQNTHDWFFSKGASASLADRSGNAPASAPSRAGQAIARSGSSQRTACSHSRLQKSVVL